MQSPFIEVSRIDDVTVMKFNRPQKLNAITVDMDRAWVAALRDAEADPAVRAVVIHGEGRAFSAGHDMVDVGHIMADLGEAASDWNQVYARVWPDGSPVQQIAEMSKPIVAAVHGQVVGMMIPAVFSCDLIVAAPGTVFNLEVLRTGGGAGLAPYVGLIPPVLINELAFTGRITSDQLLAGGAINRVLPVEDVFAEALGLARSAATVLPVSMTAYKVGVRSILRGQGVGDPAAMQRGGVASHGGPEDTEFWQMASQKNVAAALQWRDGAARREGEVHAGAQPPEHRAHRY
jgi:enoyl-CoA hydratase/carnithine racemase